MQRRYDLTDNVYAAAQAAFREAIDKAEGQTPFAKICGCTQGNISQLLSNGSLLPVRFVRRAEAATGVPRHRLRPDIFGLPSCDPEGTVAPALRSISCDPAPVLHHIGGDR